MADSQRDRLVELLEVSVYGNIEIYDGFIGPEVNCENVADHLLANGVIVPPVEVGQTVWHLIQQYNGTFRIDEGKISMLTQKADKSWRLRITVNSSVWGFTPNEIGTRYFLTKEEAEAELRKRSNDNA